MELFDLIKELFEAEDLWVYLLIGFVFAAAAGVTFYRQKVRIIRACAAAAGYAVCELLTDIRVIGGVASLLLGTFLLGKAIGFGAAAVFGKATGKKDRLIA